MLDLTQASYASPIELIAWMASPTRAFFLVNDSAKTEDGTLDAQTGTFSDNFPLNKTSRPMDLTRPTHSPAWAPSPGMVLEI